jgi:AcrR family transcriptional regulator
VRAAAELFDRDGFAGATLDDISTAAGVTKGALYFHFSSKEKLVAALQAEAVEMLAALVAKLAAADTQAMQSLIDLNHEVVRWLREETTVRACFRIYRDIGQDGGPALDFCRSWLAATEWLLHGARREKGLAEHVAIEPAATLVVGLCLGIELLRGNGVPDNELSGDLSDMWKLLLPNLVGGVASHELKVEGSDPGQGAN